MFDPELWHRQRRAWIIARLAEIQPSSVLDLGCGAGRLLANLALPARTLASTAPATTTTAAPVQSSTAVTLPSSIPLPTLDPSPRLLTGLDVSESKLAAARTRLASILASEDPTRPRFEPLDIRLLQGNLAQHDPGLEGYDVVVATEVIEHLSEPVAQAFAPEVLGRLRPKIVLLTTPNYAFHVHLDHEPLGKDQVGDLTDGQSQPGASLLQVDPTGKTERKFRHADHQFEWTPGEFRRWAVRAARAHGYVAEIGGIGGSMDVRTLASDTTDSTTIGRSSNDPSSEFPRWDGGGSLGNSQGWRLPPPKDAPDAPPSSAEEEDGSLLFALDEGPPDPEQVVMDVSYATHVAVFWRIPTRASSSGSRSSGTTSHSRGRAAGHWGSQGRGPNASSPSTSTVPTHASRSPASTTTSGTDDRRGRSKVATPLNATATAVAADSKEPKDGEPSDQTDGGGEEEEEEDPDDGRRVRSREPACLTFLGDLLHNTRSPVRKSTVHEVVAQLHATPRLASGCPSYDTATVVSAVQSFLARCTPGNPPSSTCTLQALWDDANVRLASCARVDHLLHSLGLPLPAPLPQPRGWVQAQVAARRRSTPSILPPGPTYVGANQQLSSGVLATSPDRTWSLALETNRSSSPPSSCNNLSADHVILTYTPTPAQQPQP